MNTTDKILTTSTRLIFVLTLILQLLTLIALVIEYLATRDLDLSEEDAAEADCGDPQCWVCHPESYTP